MPAGKPAKNGKDASRGLGKAARVVRAAAERAARASSTLVGSDAANRVALFVGTKKGAWFLLGDAERRRFRLEGPHFLGSTVHHVVLDPRDRRTLLLASRSGLHRSMDFGKTWTVASRPPERAGFWLTPGHVSQPEVWWAGTVPHGLFRSHDGGVTWDGVDGFNRNPMGVSWSDPHFRPTPDGAITHSVLVDPRDPEHLYAGLSLGGLFETRDGGVNWSPLNPPENSNSYDPYCVALHPKQPDRLFQTSRSGVYRLDRPGDAWERIGRNLPPEIGDIGFPIVLHPREPGSAWMFPMDATAAFSRTSPEGRPAVYRTRDAGGAWERQDKGLPPAQAWYTVKRQAMACDARDPAGLYFGTTSGEIWASADEGASWRCLVTHLPHILSVSVAEVPAAVLL